MKYSLYKFADGHTVAVVGKWPAWQIKQEEKLHGKCISKQEKKM